MDWKELIEGMVFTHTYWVVMAWIVARLINSFLSIFEKI